MQFTDAPTAMLDLNNDGKAELVAVPNAELNGTQSCGGYQTQNRVLFVVSGAQGNGGDPDNTSSNACYRFTGFDGVMPPSGGLFTCQSCQYAGCTQSTGQCIASTYYPPRSVPAVAYGDVISSNSYPELVFSFDDGAVVCYDGGGNLQWTFNFANKLGINNQVQAIEASESVLADLNADGVPEVIFSVYGYPSATADNQWLFVLSNTGAMLQQVNMTTSLYKLNGNGNGAAGAPTVADVNGDGTLEILSHTFDGRLLVYTVASSAPNCLMWPTSRGGYLRKGQPDIPYTY